MPLPHTPRVTEDVNGVEPLQKWESGPHDDRRTIEGPHATTATTPLRGWPVIVRRIVTVACGITPPDDSADLNNPAVP